MGWNGLERNKLDYILTDLLPVEISELFSFSQLYAFLLQKENQKQLNELINGFKKKKAEGNSKMFENGWSTKPLKYKILKGTDTMREMSVIQPFSALNLFFFIECYQKDILIFFEKHHEYSIRYHRKNTGLYYKSKSWQTIHYFQNNATRMKKKNIQQAGNYFNIFPYESINSFTGSDIWRLSNFKYKYYAKLDYKACFDSIYTHAFTWIIEKNVIDAKNAHNTHLFITIDRILQNINGRSSNGIVVGPEFSRMMAEILLQHIDSEIHISLSKQNITYDVDYTAFRYVDDIFLFANQAHVIEQIISKYKVIGERYLLRLNELKMIKGTTPYLSKGWLEKTRQLSDFIGNLFYHNEKPTCNQTHEENNYIVKSDFISIDRIKDEIAVLIKEYSDDKRTIVSFLLSTLLNNISKKKNGYRLFGEKCLTKARDLIDLALFIYAFYPSFDQTRKIISMISYINSEVDFINETKSNTKINKLINNYSFIFNSGNIFDLCDWFPFFHEYHLVLDVKTENFLVQTAEEYNNPIIWANLLLYSQYSQSFSSELLKKLEAIIEDQLSKLTNKEPMMQLEFWYILIFHNCPHISQALRNRMTTFINDIKMTTESSNLQKPSDKTTILICNFLEQRLPTGEKGKESLFNWGGSLHFAEQLTYRTYQRTIFKRYQKKLYGLHTSLD